MKSKPQPQSTKPSRRGGEPRAVAQAAAAAAPAGASGIANVPGVTASAKLLELDRGLYGLRVGQIGGDRHDLAGLPVPATHIAAWPVEGLAGAEILAAATGPAGWLGPEGGTIAVKIPAERGLLLITTYRLEAQAAAPLEIQVTRMDRPVQAMPAPAAPAEASAAGAGRSSRPARSGAVKGEVPIEIVLHIERAGDRRFGGGQWVGSRGQKLRIEAFSVRPLEKLTAAEIEYKAFGPGGRETPWVSAAKLCGTRGRGIPLTGFAVRLAGAARERFEVVYDGSFFESGAAGPRRNGEPCMPARIDDPLEAVNIRLVERTSR